MGALRVFPLRMSHTHSWVENKKKLTRTGKGGKVPRCKSNWYAFFSVQKLKDKNQG